MTRYLLFLTLLTSLLAEAKIHVEPYAGYGLMWSRAVDLQALKQEVQTVQQEQNRIDQVQKGIEGIQKGLNTIRSVTTYGGYSGGLRLGYSNLGLAMGVDITYGRFGKFYGITNASLSSLSLLSPGIFVSYKLPLLFRVYGSLIPNLYKLSFIQLENRDGTKTTCNGAGGKVGFSYLSLPFLSVNFEWQGLYGTSPNAQCNQAYNNLSGFVNLIF